jgi:hypothetical protein
MGRRQDRPESQSNNQATRALRHRREPGSSVVWLNDPGVPKPWCARWTETGLINEPSGRGGNPPKA